MHRCQYCVIALCAAVVVLDDASRGIGLAESNVEQGQIAATYRVDLTAFNLGEFNLTAKLQGPAYKLQAQGRFSFITGLIYRASGRTTSTGKLSKVGAEPASFTVNYKGGDKKEERRISFADGAVEQVSIIPPKKDNPHRVPITEAQLQHVLDPLTAAFLSVRSDETSSDLDVCKQTIPVFDGRQRFDLILTPKRSETVEDDAPANLSGQVAVCRVKFVPIAGHRPDHPGVKFMTETDDIEVWLVSPPGTDRYIPYKIFVPTALGGGRATLTEIQVR